LNEYRLKDGSYTAPRYSHELSPHHNIKDIGVSFGGHNSNSSFAVLTMTIMLNVAGRDVMIKDVAASVVEMRRSSYDPSRIFRQTQTTTDITTYLVASESQSQCEPV
jgi:hypothetical protein